MFSFKHRGRSAPMRMPDEFYRAHGLPTWGDKIAEAVDQVLAARRRTERDRIADIETKPRTYQPDSRLTRSEVAALLRMSIRNVQRMEKRGKLVRAPQFGREVVYWYRDVRRIASAVGKER